MPGKARKQTKKETAKTRKAFRNLKPAGHPGK